MQSSAQSTAVLDIQTFVPLFAAAIVSRKFFTSPVLRKTEIGMHGVLHRPGRNVNNKKNDDGNNSRVLCHGCNIEIGASRVNDSMKPEGDSFCSQS